MSRRRTPADGSVHSDYRAKAWRTEAQAAELGHIAAKTHAVTTE